MSSIVRVLHVFGKMNRGGAETMIMNLYRNIDRSKIQFDFIVHTNSNCDYDNEIIELGGKIHRVPSYMGSNHFEYKKVWKEFFINYPEYKIIHGHIRSTASIYLSTAKKYGLFTIAHSHSTSSGTGFSGLIKRIMQYRIKYVADNFFACSDAAGKWLFGSEITKKQNYHVLNNSIDAKKFVFNEVIRSKQRKNLNVEDKLVIGHIGRFDSPKNHDYLIEIFKEIYNRNRNVVLLLVGDGMLRKPIEEKVNKYGLSENVIFTGVRSDIPELLQAMDLFVFPSIYEGLGIALIEAQASGLICFASEEGVPKEAKISPLLNYISLKKTAEGWAEEILTHNINYKREDMYNTVVNSKFDIESTVNWLERFYLNV